MNDEGGFFDSLSALNAAIILLYFLFYKWGDLTVLQLALYDALSLILSVFYVLLY